MSQDDDESDAQVRESYRRMRTLESPGPAIDAHIRAAAVAAADARHTDGNKPPPGVIAAAQSANAAVPAHGAAAASTRRRANRRMAYLGWGGALAAGLALFAVVLPMGKPPVLNDAAGFDPAAVAPMPSPSGVHHGQTLETHDKAQAMIDAGAERVALFPRAAVPPVREVVGGARAETTGEERAAVNAEVGAEGVAETTAAESAGRRRSSAPQAAPFATQLPLSSMAQSPPPAVPSEAPPAQTPLDNLPQLSGAVRTSRTAQTRADAAVKVADTATDRVPDNAAVDNAAVDKANESSADEVAAALDDLRRLYGTHDAALLPRLRAFVARYPDYPLRRTDPELDALLQR